MRGESHRASRIWDFLFLILEFIKKLKLFLILESYLQNRFAYLVAKHDT